MLVSVATIKQSGCYIAVHRTTAAFGCHPMDVLQWVLDVTRLAVHAVLRVDLQLLRAIVTVNELIDACGAVAAFGASVAGEIVLDRDRRIAQLQVHRLVFLVVGVRQNTEDSLSKTDDAVGLRVDLRHLVGRLQVLIVRFAMAQRPADQFAQPEIVHPHVNATVQGAQRHAP